MNITNALTIGANGLAAAAAGTNVASQNISNADTPGYTRKAATMDAIPLSEAGGVRFAGVSREQDTFLETRALSAGAQSGEADSRVKTTGVLDTVFNNGQGSVGEALDDFESSLTDFSNDPSSTPSRQVVLSRADDLSQAFHRASEALTQARVDANTSISSDVSTVNQKITQIGALNGQIAAATNVGQDASDLEDQRDQLVRDVANILPVNVIPGTGGTITLMLAGSRNLVDADGDVHTLTATPDPTTGDVTVTRQTAGATEDVTSLISTGTIGGTIAARDGALATARTSLDQLAFDTANAYNAVQAAGVGSDGNTGRNLFTPSATVDGAAENMSVSSDVVGHPEFLAGAQDATALPGDNRNALAMLAVSDQKVAEGGTATVQDAFSDMVAAGGTASQSAIDQQTHATATLTQVNALRDSASGVSTDDEMVSMMKYQRAYQASLRVIETADSMMSSLLSINIGS